MFNKKHGNKHGIGTMHVLEKYICKCISQNKLYIHWSAAGYEASGIVWLEQPEVLLVRFFSTCSTRPSVSPLVRRLTEELTDAPLLTHGGETRKMVTGLLFKSSEFGFIVLETCDPVRSESRDEPVMQLFRKSPQQRRRQQQHVLLEVCDESSSRFPVGGGGEHQAAAVAAPRISSRAPVPSALSIPPGSRPSGGQTPRRAALPAAPPPAPRRLESAGTE